MISFFGKLIFKFKKISPLESFWNGMTTLFSDRFSTALKSKISKKGNIYKLDHPTIKNLLIEEYPQLLYLFTEFIKSFDGHLPFLTKDSLSVRYIFSNFSNKY